MIINELKTPQIISDFSEKAKKGLQSGFNFAKNHKLAISMVALTAIAAATTFYFCGSASPSPTSPIPKPQPQQAKKVIIQPTEKIQQISEQVIPQVQPSKADSTALVLINKKVDHQPEQDRGFPFPFNFFFLQNSPPTPATTIPKEELPSSNEFVKAEGTFTDLPFQDIIVSAGLSIATGMIIGNPVTGPICAIAVGVAYIESISDLSVIEGLQEIFSSN